MAGARKGAGKEGPRHTEFMVLATKVTRRKLREAEGAGKVQVVRGHRGQTARTRCHLD